MRIDFSEPECSNCFHCRSLGILNTQESEPSNVIGSSVTPLLVNSKPVQALGHESAPVGSTSTSSPVQALGHDDSAASGSISTFSFRSQTPPAPPVITPVCSEPVQTLAPTSLRSDVFGSPALATSDSGASATSTSSTSSKAFGQPTFAFGSPPKNIFGFAPAFTSVSSAPPQAFGFGSSPIRFGFAPAVTLGSSAPMQAFSPKTFGFDTFPVATQHRNEPMQDPAQATSGSTLFAAPQPGFGSMQAPVQAISGSTLFAAPQPDFGSMQAPVQATSGSTLFAAPQPGFGSTQAPVQATSGFVAFSDTTPPRFGLGSTQAPVEANFGSGASGTSTSSCFLPFGSVPAPPTNGSSLFGSLQSVPTGVNRFSLPPLNCFGKNMSTTGFVSPGFGVDYLPGFNSNPFGQNLNTTGSAGSIFDGPKTSSPQPFYFNAATNPLPRSSLSSPATFISSNPNTGFNPFHVWSHHTEQSSSYPRYAPTPNEETCGMYTSISASKAFQHKSHEELRWEDYKQGNIGSRTNTVFGSPPMASPSLFASPSVPVHPQRTTFGPTRESFTIPVSCFAEQKPAFKGFGTTQESFTSPVSFFAQYNPAFTGFGTQFPNSSSSFFNTFPSIGSSVQRPHETAAVSSPASGCTACGSTTSTPASGYSTFNGATSAATTSLPGMFYPPYGYVPMMFGTTPAPQVTTPVLQAYPVNGYVLLPFAAMSLQ